MKLVDRELDTTTSHLQYTNDLTGIEVVTEEPMMPFLARLEDDERMRYRNNLCPAGLDDRDFVARQARFDDAGTLDRNGNPANGYVYCNLELEVMSRCENDLWDEHFFKGFTKTDELQMCSDYDPVGSRSFQPSPSCFNDALPEIFDGDTDLYTGEAGEFKFAVEEPLARRVLIPCLSFDPSGTGCDVDAGTALGP